MAIADVRLGASWTRAQRLKNDAIYVVVVVLLALARVLPRSFVRVACAALALVAYALLPRVRARVARRAEKAAIGEEPHAFARSAFAEAGRTLADTLALLDPRESPSRSLVLEEESKRVFASALADGRGVVFVSAHLGAWERLAAVLAAEGFPVATVARESYDPRLTRIYDELRQPRGVRSIYRGRPGAAVAVARELAAGRAVGLLIDLPSRVPSAPAELLGEAVDLPSGAARLAIARGAALVVGTVTRSRAIRVTRLCAEGVERDLQARIVHELDRRIRAWPEAWLGLFAGEPPT